MKLTNIKVSLAYESPTNPRGTDFKGPAFDDLVASVKEKGVLVPVIARPKGERFEVVAGNRRLRAAKVAGLTEIPARVEDLSDEEAREVQIIENLHREDVHPLEEGEAYRQLAEKSNLEVEVIAAKVGKSVSYVKRRLILTDLTTSSKEAYRNGTMNAGQAELVSRLDQDEQKKVVDFIRRREPDMEELREEVQRLRIGKLSATPPWKNHEALVAAMAPCAECNKKKGGNLFGEGAAEQCGDPTCFARRLAAHIELVKRDMKEKKVPLTLISTRWRSDVKGALAGDDWRRVNAKVPCKSQHKALVVDGDDDLGKVIDICTDNKCSVHGPDRASVYRVTPQEKAARKRARQVAEAKEKREAKKVADAAKKVKLPFGEKASTALLEAMIWEVGSDRIRTLVKAKGWEVPRVKTRYSGPKGSLSYEDALRTAAKTMTFEQRLQLAFEGFLTSHYESHRITKLL